jgi:hypothetical protein
MRQHFTRQIYVLSLQNLYEWSCGCHCKFPGAPRARIASFFLLGTHLAWEVSQGLSFFHTQYSAADKKTSAKPMDMGASNAVMSCESCRHY